MKPKSKKDLGNKADRLNTRPVEGNDRFNLQFGAGQTYDDTNALMKTKFEFSTKLEL